ncbi:MAG: hypothetical protein QM692_09255 [Thermomicrobiales bacterium]
MIDLEPEDLDAIGDALARDKERLTALLRDYKGQRNQTRNPVVKAMAEEGAANMQLRITELEALLAKVRGPRE